MSIWSVTNYIVLVALAIAQFWFPEKSAQIFGVLCIFLIGAFAQLEKRIRDLQRKSTDEYQK